MVWASPCSYSLGGGLLDGALGKRDLMAGHSGGASLTASRDLQVGPGRRAAVCSVWGCAGRPAQDAVTWLLKNLSHLVQTWAEL